MKKGALLVNDSKASVLNDSSGRNAAFLFIRNAISNPRTVGALIPASKALSTKIACICYALNPTTLVELGPGTGVITDKILGFKPKLVEIDPKFSNHLQRKFSELEVFNECAIEYLQRIDRPVSIVCSIPLINNPISNEIKSAISRARAAGLLEWILIYSYGRKNPLAGCGFKNEKLIEKVNFNLPPARIWLNS
jgi:phosphatidylethanolamine/phosphatidyl-N-methylethanolamine N-methyltransferase